MRARNMSKDVKNQVGDQIIKLMLEKGCNNVEIQSFVNVGGGGQTEKDQTTACAIACVEQQILLLDTELNI